MGLNQSIDRFNKTDKPTHVRAHTQWRERLRELQRLVFCTFAFPRSSAAAVWVSRALILVILVEHSQPRGGQLPHGPAAARGVRPPRLHPGRAGGQVRPGRVQPPGEGSGAVGERGGGRGADGRLAGAAPDDRGVPASIVHAEALAIDLDGDLFDMVRAMNW